MAAEVAGSAVVVEHAVVVRLGCGGACSSSCSCFCVAAVVAGFAVVVEPVLVVRLALMVGPAVQAVNGFTCLLAEESLLALHCLFHLVGEPLLSCINVCWQYQYLQLALSKPQSLCCFRV